MDLTELSPVAAAQAALDTATRALKAGLRKGEDVTAAREAIDAATTALTAAMAVRDMEARATKLAAEQAEDAAVDAAVEAATSEVIEIVQRIDAAPDLVELPEVYPTPAVAQAAENVVRAAAALERAQAPILEAEADRAVLARRLAETEAVEAEIRERRRGGDARATDAAELHLAATDAADLRAMVAEADQRIAALQPSRHLLEQVEHTRAALAVARRQAIVTQQVDRLRLLEAALIAAHRALGTTTAELGMWNLGSVYLPSDEIRRLAAGGRL